MPAKAKSLRTNNVADDPVASEAPTATLSAAPIDAPPSFLEKSEPAAAEPIRPRCLPSTKRSRWRDGFAAGTSLRAIT